MFVHFSAVTGGGYRSLEEGQKVEFDITQGQKGTPGGKRQGHRPAHRQGRRRRCGRSPLAESERLRTAKGR